MKILFVSDYVCPFCIVAKEALKQAMKELGITADITWQPYELTEEPKEQIDTYHDTKRAEHYKKLFAPAAALGLDTKFPPHVVPRPYTRLAFEGYYYAKDQGRGDEYNDLVYRAYFIDERNIGDMDVLCDLAVKAGLNAAGYRTALEQGTYSAVEKEAVRYSKDTLCVKQVPTVYIDDEMLDIQEYTKEEFVKFLSQRG